MSEDLKPTPGIDARAEDFCAWLDDWTAQRGYRPDIGDAFDAAYRIAWKRAVAALPLAPQVAGVMPGKE